MATIDFSSQSFLLDSYTGQGGFLTGQYLIQYLKEPNEKYEQRKLLSIRPNFVKKIVDSYLGYLFRTPASRTCTVSEYKQFVDNADGLGISLDEFMRTAEKYAMLYGTIYLIVDLDENSSIPYLSIRTHYQVDSSQTEYDSRGRLLSIAFRESYDGESNYRYFDTTRWMIQDSEGNKTREGEHGLGVVPVIALHCQEPVLGSYIASSWIYDIARLNFDLYNVISEAREILRNITFPILIYPMRYGGEEKDPSWISTGTNNALRYNPDDGPPSFISPSPESVTQLKKHAEDIIRMTYQQVSLEYVSGFASGSGTAIAYFFQQTQSNLSGMIGRVESVENRIGQLVCKYVNQTYAGPVSYSRDFDLEDMKSELELTMDALSLNISATFEKELKKKAARDILGREIGAEVYKMIDSEIDHTAEPYSDVMNNVPAPAVA